ncbi:MAG: phosphate regulon sensor histidine kinase PhoR [Sulfuricellaceae bacterium]|nr:phosphate regulon sensor histidine kinase PhoR [Sulfuricellaceae bacterium]
MLALWWSLLWPLFMAALLALVLWPLAGAVRALLFFSAFVLIILLRHMASIAALARWLRSPATMEVPEGTGVWDAIFDALYQNGRAQSGGQSNLNTALARFQKAAEAMPDGIVMLNDEGQIEWCNPMAESQFGISNHQDHLQRISYLVRQLPFIEHLAARNYAEPLVMKSARNANMTLSVQLVPFGDRQKMLISRDITHLEQVETMRRDFIANVSHELRTPLTVVGGFLESFADAEQIDMALSRRHFQLMQDQTQRMRGLIEDLLTLSRLESTHERMAETPVSMTEMAQTLLREAMSLSAGRHILRLEMGTDKGLTGSERDLHSALINLVSNAIRYTPDQGEVVLRWEMRGDEAWFCVQDSGLGIEPQHINRLTERFYRVDRGRSRETGGTGLGLSIVKHVLTRHQGWLHIQSEPGKGSLFCACFPAGRIIDDPDELPRS